ncbi:ribosome modulation factor [Pseudomonas oryzihabitans]|uniref:ribosome modulation factor n=1 Tax=Pseudomonas oryzihabitans TaxID=47885 RepID=UPI0009DF0BAF|nr:CrpP family ICE-associated protein [Pseudomonas oryzihabitans]NMZ44161.1 CrpP family protein [Pseudomonas oryzihabitans]
MPVAPQESPNSTDHRVRNAPHARAMREGADAARAHAAVHLCPYRNPGLRTSWLRGYAQAQQQSFDF